MKNHRQEHDDTGSEHRQPPSMPCCECCLLGKVILASLVLAVVGIGAFLLWGSEDHSRMDLSGEATHLNIQEAMKILNMTEFTAKELNAKFQYRVQSITRGLGGSLKSQKNVYTAWEYLNRMLVRETSNSTEEVLKKVDKTVKMLEKPKRLDMIPVRLTRESKKGSLIIEKNVEPQRVKGPKVRFQRKPRKHQATDEENRRDPEKSLGVSALPGRLLQNHLKWMEQDRLNPKTQSSKGVANRTVDRKGESVRLNNTKLRQPQKDATTLQLKEIIRIDRDVRNTDVTEKQEELGKMLDKLPKLPRSQSQATLFKKTTALNEIFENPRKPSKYDQRSSAQRVAWKEKASQFLSDRPDLRVENAKIKSGKTTRRSISKQPVDQMLYKKENLETVKCINTGSNQKPQSQKAETSDNFKLPPGPFTPSRIVNWIKNAQGSHD